MIREGILDAIEHDDFGRLPAGLPARGYLRAYAKEVGLEPESVVQQYTMEFEPMDTADSPTQRDTDIEIVASRIQTGIGIILLVAATAFCIYLDRRDASERTAPVSSPSLGAARDVREIRITRNERTSVQESRSGRRPRTGNAGRRSPR